MVAWFDVNKEGLRQLLEERGPSFAVLELVQNAWDEDGVTQVEIGIEPVPGRPLVKLTVHDDAPDGFTDLTHAWTLFAPSAKKKDPTKRGRYNLGEKLVLALCAEAEIVSTTGGVRFDAKGRHKLRRKTTAGSTFTGLLQIRRDEMVGVQRAVRRLIPPSHIATYFRSTFDLDDEAGRLPTPEPVATAEATLPTLAEGDGGGMRRTQRKTEVRFYEPIEDGDAWVYEMGIPVVPLLSCRWSIDVAQKVPLNMDRNNVTPGYLASLRVLALNATADTLRPEDATSLWVKAAAEDERCEDDAIKAVVKARFGDKTVIRDPSDPEGTMNAVAAGYTVLEPGTFGRGAWDNIRRSGASLPAGKVTPSSKPYSDDPDAPEVHVVDPAKYTAAQKVVIPYIERLAQALIGSITVRVVRTTNNFAAAFGGRCLDLNVFRLGHRWFEHAAAGASDPANLDALHELLFHELAHDRVSNHLDRAFADECNRISAKAVRLALTSPELFEMGN